MGRLTRALRFAPKLQHFTKLFSEQVLLYTIAHPNLWRQDERVWLQLQVLLLFVWRFDGQNGRSSFGVFRISIVLRFNCNRVSLYFAELHTNYKNNPDFTIESNSNEFNFLAPWDQYSNWRRKVTEWGFQGPLMGQANSNLARTSVICILDKAPYSHHTPFHRRVWERNGELSRCVKSMME